MGELMRKANETGVALTGLGLAPAALGGLIRLVDAGTITSPVAKEVFEKMIATGRPADAIVAAEGLARIDDESAIESAVRQVIDANADAVTQYRAGKQQTFGFLVGQVMKATRGKANPARVNELMRRLLDQA
jgi:aspartyl-tRNA(Asn)/glutamyl-tRNA(Gln) amidotransferase subunit B